MRLEHAQSANTKPCTNSQPPRMTNKKCVGCLTCSTRATRYPLDTKASANFPYEISGNPLCAFSPFM